jgi:hypothetical protein
MEPGDCGRYPNSYLQGGVLMGIGGMILGIIAVIFAFIPVVGAFIAIPCAVVGLPLSAIGFVIKRRRGEGRGMAIAGMATCTIGLVIAIAWLVAFGAAVVDEVEGDSRAYMLSQPCEDIMAEYNSMKVAGHDVAVLHVANVYNIKADLITYVTSSDARARIDQCS